MKTLDRPALCAGPSPIRASDGRTVAVGHIELMPVGAGTAELRVCLTGDLAGLQGLPRMVIRRGGRVAMG